MIFTKNGKKINEDDQVLKIFEPSEGSFGVFETMRTYDGKIFRLRDHLERLLQSAKLIRLSLPCSRKVIEKYILESLKFCNFDPVRIKVVATPEDVLVKCEKLEIDEKIYEGVSVMTVRMERNAPEAKSLDYLKNFQAHEQAKKQGCFEALLVDKEGIVREGAYSNVFWVKSGKLFTTDKKVLKGITRQTILEMADCEFAEITDDELKKTDEIFLTQTTREIIPVVKIDGVRVGNGKIGSKTESLRLLFQKKRHRSSVESLQPRIIKLPCSVRKR